MPTKRAFVRSALALALLTPFVSKSSAQDAPPPPAPPPGGEAAPATTAPAPAPHVVSKGRLALKFDAAGTFLPAGAVEVRVRPEAYKGDLTIVSAAPVGASVRNGDTILQIDPTDLNRDLEGARNDLTAARAGLTKAEAEVAHGAKGDALALKIAENAAKKAVAELKWWDELTGPQMLEQMELSLRQQRSFVEDQQDELEQLKAMYKTEDLTGATADIVLKRAVRQYEIGQIRLKMLQEASRRTKEYDHPGSRLPYEYSVEQTTQALEQLKTAQAHSKVTRETSLKSAQLALAAAEKRVSELEKDLGQFTVRAPADGVVLYGQLSESALTPIDPRALRPGEKVPPGGTVMVLVTPGALRLTFDLPESKLAWVKPGIKATVAPIAWPELSYSGTVGAPPLLGKSAGPEQTFPVSIELSGLDPRIAPGMKATVKIDAGEGDEVVLVPADAVAGGKVRVRTKDGNEEDREVVTGRTDGTSVEIRKGLDAGEEILLGVKS
jgi:multidrug resistance efflux pump